MHTGRCVAGIIQERPRRARIPHPCFVGPTFPGGKGATGAGLGRGPWGAAIAGCGWGAGQIPQFSPLSLLCVEASLHMQMNSSSGNYSSNQEQITFLLFTFSVLN